MKMRILSMNLSQNVDLEMIDQNRKKKNNPDKIKFTCKT